MIDCFWAVGCGNEPESKIIGHRGVHGEKQEAGTMRQQETGVEKPEGSAGGSNTITGKAQRSRVPVEVEPREMMLQPIPKECHH